MAEADETDKTLLTALTTNRLGAKVPARRDERELEPKEPVESSREREAGKSPDESLAERESRKAAGFCSAGAPVFQTRLGCRPYLEIWVAVFQTAPGAIMANSTDLVATATTCRDTITTMDAISQKKLTRIAELARQALTGSRKSKAALIKIMHEALELQNDINYAAELAGCNFVGGR